MVMVVRATVREISHYVKILYSLYYIYDGIKRFGENRRIKVPTILI